MASRQTSSGESRSAPIQVPNQLTERGSDKAGPVLMGHFCEVVKGEEKGLYGVYIDNVEGDDNGRPTRVLVRERNSGRLATVDYDSLVPTQPGDVGRGR